MDMGNFSDEDLEEELKRRKQVRSTLPEESGDPDWEPVLQMCRGQVQEVIDGKYHEDNDFDHCLFEEVMKTVYGPDFFNWWNKNAYQ
jgi:hypothetical protein